MTPWEPRPSSASPPSTQKSPSSPDGQLGSTQEFTSTDGSKIHQNLRSNSETNSSTTPKPTDGKKRADSARLHHGSHRDSNDYMELAIGLSQPSSTAKNTVLVVLDYD
mgnify:CR=1 FL=1